MPEPLLINDMVTIPAHELTWTAVRGGGPGGQNVNKVASKVELRFALKYSRALTPAVKTRLRALAGKRINIVGELILVGAGERDQPRNLEDVRARLRGLILQALVPPKIRRKTKPTRGSVQRRLTEKKSNKEKKQNRRVD